jgi:hypothetical protein
MRPTDPIGEQVPASWGVYERLARYPLLDALTERRSRRFGKGMSLNGDRSPTTARTLRNR